MKTRIHFISRIGTVLKKPTASLLFLCAIATPLLAAETILWQENFDDGNGDGRWFAEQGVWQIGSPTVGPQTNAIGLRARSGSYCATTAISENYLSGQDSRLIRIVNFTVPASNQFPRLRFWQWFSFAGPYCPFNCDEGSYGYVEIKTGSTWQQVSPTYTSSGSGVWSQPSIDLTPFAGRSVQIAFHFHSAHYTDVGWYIDDIAVVTGTPVMNETEGFESGLGDWYAESGTWEVGVPGEGPAANSIGRRAFRGTNCAATVLKGSYASHIDSRLASPPFVVPAASTSPRLRFWHWFSFASPYCPFNCDEGSYGFVEIKAGTNDWQQVSPSYVNSSSGTWTRSSIDLRDYAGQTVKVAFRCHSAQYTDVGWYIDDVTVVTGPPVMNNPETFEAGLGDWYAEAGTWEVGMPGVGPSTNSAGHRAFSGTNCAATVLSGSYASRVDSRLISPAFVVPAANNSPRLRFWHWYSFAGPYCPFNCDEGSYGYVEVKAGTNNWQQVSLRYVNSSSGVWTRPSIDLSAFAGQTVTVAFHCHSAQYTDVGWYIDDVAIVTGSPSANNPEGFETGLGDWYAESGTWEVGRPRVGPPTNAVGQRAFTGTNAAATVLGDIYGSYIDSRFFSPPFIVPPSSTAPALRFRHWFDFAGPYCPFNCDEGSYGYVEVKAGTNDWETVSPRYSGQSGGWGAPTFIPLARFGGQQIQVAFHFHSARNTAQGWYLDEVRLVHSPALVLLDSPIVRTQNTTCISFGLGANSPAAALSFIFEAPAVNLADLSLTTDGCWSGNVSSQSESRWLVTLRNTCTNVEMGVRPIGSLCFTAGSAQSVLAALSASDLVVTNVDGSTPASQAFGSRAVVIADKPVLEAWLGANRRRMATLYGVPGKTYVTRRAGAVTDSLPWIPVSTNTIGASLLSSFSLSGVSSNAPLIFLNANEQ